jgi:hypothetical protein
MDSWGWDRAEEAALVNLRAIERRNGGSDEGEAGTGADDGTREERGAISKVGTQNQEETGSKSTREGMTEKEEKGEAHHDDGGHDGGRSVIAFNVLCRCGYGGRCVAISVFSIMQCFMRLYLWRSCRPGPALLPAAGPFTQPLSPLLPTHPSQSQVLSWTFNLY